jgi:hypothetical protein
VLHPSIASLYASLDELDKSTLPFKIGALVEDDLYHIRHHVIDVHQFDELPISFGPYGWDRLYASFFTWLSEKIASTPFAREMKRPLEGLMQDVYEWLGRLTSALALYKSETPRSITDPVILTLLRDQVNRLQPLLRVCISFTVL